MVVVVTVVLLDVLIVVAVVVVDASIVVVVVVWTLVELSDFAVSVLTSAIDCLHLGRDMWKSEFRHYVQWISVPEVHASKYPVSFDDSTVSMLMMNTLRVFSLWLLYAQTLRPSLRADHQFIAHESDSVRATPLAILLNGRELVHHHCYTACT